MILFKKKPKPAASPPKKSLQEIVYERVLTAEGWRRKLLKQAKKK